MEICNGRPTEKISAEFIAELLGANFNNFPESTKFRLYENQVPIALIPTPNGGVVCLAFDTSPPRGFPVGSFEKSDTISYEEFKSRLTPSQTPP